ncbi:MAG: hypothetical protein ABI747_04630 [Candidatus Moraniibacteriota bacterium]
MSILLIGVAILHGIPTIATACLGGGKNCSLEIITLVFLLAPIAAIALIVAIQRRREKNTEKL